MPRVNSYPPDVKTRIDKSRRTLKHAYDNKGQLESATVDGATGGTNVISKLDTLGHGLLAVRSFTGRIPRYRSVEHEIDEYFVDRLNAYDQCFLTSNSNAEHGNLDKFSRMKLNRIFFEVSDSCIEECITEFETLKTHIDSVNDHDEFKHACLGVLIEKELI